MLRDGGPAPADGSPRHVGRPRRAATDASIIRAAVELMTEGGVQATTLTAVARRAGVARATVYLRWPTRSALIGAAARAAVGGQVLPLTGDVEHDIRAGAAFIQRVFELPTSQAILPEIVRGVLANPPELRFDAVAPRRREFARLYRAGAEAAGLDPEIDPHLPFDILLGTAIASLLANGRPMSRAEADRLAEVLIAGLRVQNPEPNRRRSSSVPGPGSG
jgi:AcrR family transcriptional regulator